MSQGKRAAENQRAFWTPTNQLARAWGNVFYDKRNRLLAENGLDLCQPLSKTGGRP